MLMARPRVARCWLYQSWWTAPAWARWSAAAAWFEEEAWGRIGLSGWMAASQAAAAFGPDTDGFTSSPAMLPP